MTSTIMPPMLSPKTPHHRQQAGRSPSPNYFALHVDPSNSTVKSTGSGIARTPLSPASAHLFTTAGTSPQRIIANNPDYEAFLKQTEQNRITLNRNNIPPPVLPPSPPNGSSSSSSQPLSKNSSNSSSIAAPSSMSKAETIANDEATHHSRSPKRLLSTDSVSILAGPRRQSPADFNDTASARSLGSPPQRPNESPMRLSLPPRKVSPPKDLGHHRADTEPTSIEPCAPSFVRPQQAIEMLAANGDKVLLLDLRVSTQYAQARIDGALNLCMPTTLLKRTSYNVSRLADTFKDEGQKAKFRAWKSCSIILVYDGASTQLSEASNCVNILKKFASEGWQGQSIIIKGGFAETASKFPAKIDDATSGSRENPSANLTIREGNSLPPVMGGCPMPATQNAANPFFGTVRQNMDLLDGVGQIPVQCPPSLTQHERTELPEWLRQAIDERDNGKTVSEKFLRIEKREQKRMQQALSGDPKAGSPSVGPVQKVEIAGIERGDKNRYTNIFPFEHSRVRLKKVPRDGCDYMNANFLSSSMSHKKYIATQGPIPSTFADFWNMIWERDTRVVVMLTAETEGGQLKAHNYWKEKRYGSVRMNHHSEHRVPLEASKVQPPSRDRPDVMARRRSSHMDKLPSSNTKEETPHVIVRKFTISHDDYPFARMREITHLQFSTWPDFGTPAHPSHLLALVEQCDSVVRSTSTGPTDAPEPPNDRPVVVHCSAGCGRTGTFATVDAVIDTLKRQKRRRNRPREPTPMDIDGSQQSPASKGSDGRGASSSRNIDDEGDWLTRDDVDLIEKTVEEFRVQRLSMVQSLRQFVLCYETVLEWVGRQGIPKTA